ncbi:MAG TPA: hypothetical protein VL201_02845 [Patescibacteria group bacterium]|jgi:hypothetical protein|nr:hypothetical protein [Patescibacteria group bacterium]
MNKHIVYIFSTALYFSVNYIYTMQNGFNLDQIDLNIDLNHEDYETDEEKNTPMKKPVILFEDVFSLIDCSEQSKKETVSQPLIHGMPIEEYFEWYENNTQTEFSKNKRIRGQHIQENQVEKVEENNIIHLPLKGWQLNKLIKMSTDSKIPLYKIYNLFHDQFRTNSLNK